MNQQIKTSLGVVIILIIVATIGVFVWQMQKKQSGISQPTPPAQNDGGKKENPKMCTQEATLCPDGSSVSRTGPDCEFAKCSEIESSAADWQTYRNEKYGFEFKYPDKKIKLSKLEEDEYMKDSKMKSYTMNLFPINEEKAIEIENYAALKIYKNNSFDLQSYESALEAPQNKGKFTLEELSSPTGNWECNTTETLSLSLSTECVLQKGSDTFSFGSFFNSNLNKNFFSKEEFFNIVKSLKLN